MVERGKMKEGKKTHLRKEKKGKEEEVMAQRARKIEGGRVIGEKEKIREKIEKH